VNRIADNLERVKSEIARAAQRAGRSEGDVKLVCVTKTVGPKEIEELYRLGERLMGESRIQQARDKIAQLPSLPVQWRLIGHLQTNKVKQALELFQAIDSVDSLKLARELSRRAETLSEPLPILLEVNVSGEESKYGLSLEGDSVEDAPELYASIAEIARLPRLILQGLMTMAPFVDDPEEARPVFRRLRMLRDEINRRAITRAPLIELSMGMTNDFQIAVEEGATCVRIGSALFE